MLELLAGLLVFLFGYTINMTFITVFYHRGLTHKSLEMSRVAQWAVKWAGNWFTGLDPKVWACMHRMHHVYSDTDSDPHSPVKYGIIGVLRAQYDSYNAVAEGLIKGDPAYVAFTDGIDFDVNWLKRKNLWYLPYVLHGVAGLLIAELTGPLLGLCYWIGMMSHPIQGWLVNSFGHCKGYRNFNTADRSTNNTIVAWTVFGEGFQNNHHKYPASARFSCRWFEIDPGWWLCQILDSLRIVSVHRGLLIPNYSSLGARK